MAKLSDIAGSGCGKGHMSAYPEQERINRVSTGLPFWGSLTRADLGSCQQDLAPVQGTGEGQSRMGTGRTSPTWQCRASLHARRVEQLCLSEP